ncbi:hypothetical protein [Aminobacter sp. MSH1]|uniref:hypothetical protein n=1 Tax=Aminobacter sp. MSH1 TaxID=374606 RepID=UPI000D376850|nr:hypothetical protein [Aminobacter sp. MSH1]
MLHDYLTMLHPAALLVMFWVLGFTGIMMIIVGLRSTMRDTWWTREVIHLIGTLSTWLMIAAMLYFAPRVLPLGLPRASWTDGCMTAFFVTLLIWCVVMGFWNTKEPKDASG